MVKKMSVLEGADALLVGTVASMNGGASVDLRIVHIVTGAILYSTHSVIKGPEKPVRLAATKQKAKTKPESQSSPKISG